jgi:hypothetical protein
VLDPPEALPAPLPLPEVPEEPPPEPSGELGAALAGPGGVVVVEVVVVGPLVVVGWPIADGA